MSLESLPEEPFGKKPDPPALPSEQAMLDSGPKWMERVAKPTQAALVVSPGRAQVAEMLARELSSASVHAWYMDLHDATATANSLEKNDSIEVLSGADLPDQDYDLVLMPVLKRSEGELTRELLQQAHDRLPESGWLVASVDNPKDVWLHDQLQAIFDKVTCHREGNGAVYWARKTRPLKKRKNFECEITFREGDRIIRAVTRPGVFSHRRLDGGAKQLMLSSDIDSRDCVLDMGCGCGAVALAAAVRTEGQVFGVDSNARAVECLKLGAERNQLENVEAIWNADGTLQLSHVVDIALANPPYYGDDQISQHFVETALAPLRAGGALLVVTKKPGWYEASFHGVLEDVVTFEAGNYFVVCGRKPSVSVENDQRSAGA